MKAMLVAMATGRVPADVSVEETLRPIRLWAEAKFSLLRLYEGRGWTGELYMLQNVSTAPMVLAEQEFDRADSPAGGEVAGVASRAQQRKSFLDAEPTNEGDHGRVPYALDLARAHADGVESTSILGREIDGRPFRAIAGLLDLDRRTEAPPRASTQPDFQYAAVFLVGPRFVGGHEIGRQKDGRSRRPARPYAVETGTEECRHRILLGSEVQRPDEVMLGQLHSSPPPARKPAAEPESSLPKAAVGCERAGSSDPPAPSSKVRGTSRLRRGWLPWSFMKRPTLWPVP